jgi:type II secretory ATPase GspE/PulE/Tfp pilus assembly ATPase PilB-like protein
LPALVGLLLTPATALGYMPMPRGPGYYFHPAKILAVLVLYLIWARVCLWVHEDCDRVDLPGKMWNSIVTLSGLVALLFAWTLPFIIGFPLAVLIFLTGTLIYVRERNAQVKPINRVLTPRHLREVFGKLLTLGKKSKENGKKEKEVPLGLRFVGKDADADRDEKKRVRSAEESVEYQAALTLVRDAIEQKATDIHMEPTRDEMTVRFRIDGILQAVAPFTRERGDAVLNIYKVLANLDITEKRKPQDGSFSAELVEAIDGGTRTRLIDFRVSSTGSLAGEKLVIRILDKEMQTADLTKLGMRDRLVIQIRRLVAEPHGMFIVCGPTGAGKSTTLYACLAQIDRLQKNVITLENPVEYRIDHATQIEINPKAGKTFAGELRSILRQDPDVIYVGEVRDQETAEIGCQAAQTGHLVLTTLHANDTVGALARLMDLKVPVYMIASAVSGILSQRLVRVLCPKCKQSYRPSPEVLRKIGLPPDKVKILYKAREGGGDVEAEDDEDGPCEHCNGRGYKGRTGVYELLILNDKMRAMLKQNPPDLEGVRREAVRAGMKYLLEDGFRAVIEGRTSIQELLRVCA